MSVAEGWKVGVGREARDVQVGFPLWNNSTEQQLSPETHFPPTTSKYLSMNNYDSWGITASFSTE